MKPRTKEFKQAAVAAIGNKQVQANLDGLYRGFHKARDQAAEETPGWESMRDRARDVKAHTIDNLDYYLEMTERNVVAAGGNSSSPQTPSRPPDTSSSWPAPEESAS